MRLTISGSNVTVGDELAALVERRMRFALTRFGSSISEVQVTLSEDGEPRGSLAKKCKVEVRLPATHSVVAETADESFLGAATMAAGRINGAVARRVRRSRSSGLFSHQ